VPFGGAVSWTTVRSMEKTCTQACCITARTGGGSIIATAGSARKVAVPLATAAVIAVPYRQSDRQVMP
jgi:hypothetical protein